MECNYRIKKKIRTRKEKEIKFLGILEADTIKWNGKEIKKLRKAISGEPENY